MSHTVFSQSDVYAVADSHRIRPLFIFRHGIHNMTLSPFRGEAERLDLEQNGARVFFFREGITKSLIGERDFGRASRA